MGLFFKRPVPPMLILVGPVGSSKTALMNHLLRLPEVVRSRLLINIPAFAVQPGGLLKEVIIYTKFKEARPHKCCNWAIDEAGILLNSRQASSLPVWARNKLFERRKDDIDRLFMTVQSVSDVDACFRRFSKQGGELWTPKLVRLPFIGWIWPDCVREELVCPWQCGDDCTHLPGGEGDRSVWYYRVFGFGSVYVADAWDICDLVNEENGKASVSVSDDGEVDVPESLGWTWYFWSQREAQFFTSYAKVSDVADAFEDERLERRGTKVKPGDKSGVVFPGEPARIV